MFIAVLVLPAILSHLFCLSPVTKFLSLLSLFIVTLTNDCVPAVLCDTVHNIRASLVSNYRELVYSRYVLRTSDGSKNPASLINNLMILDAWLTSISTALTSRPFNPTDVMMGTLIGQRYLIFLVPTALLLLPLQVSTKFAQPI